MAIETAAAQIEIPFEAPRAVREGLAAMGRTEDVRLAPSRQRLAIACYGRGRIALVGIEIAPGGRGPAVTVTSLRELSWAGLREPHGLDFLDDDTLVVGDRAGSVSIVRLDSAGEVSSVDVLGSPLLDSPGSVAVRAVEDGCELIACSNWEDTVTRHALDATGALRESDVLVREWLDLPDGVALSADGRWLAVSNHNTHMVVVFDRETLHEDASPAAVLRGVHYPHGLRFGADDLYLLAADAGAPYVHVFRPPGNGWRGVGYPSATIEVMDGETFARGRRNAQEGGPKGIDLDLETGVLVATAEHAPLAFFDVEAALAEPRPVGIDEALVTYELESLAELARAREEASEARRDLSEVFQTKAWRLTKPLRGAYGLARRARRG